MVAAAVSPTRRGLCDLPACGGFWGDPPIGLLVAHERILRPAVCEAFVRPYQRHGNSRRIGRRPTGRTGGCLGLVLGGGAAPRGPALALRGSAVARVSSHRGHWKERRISRRFHCRRSRQTLPV